MVFLALRIFEAGGDLPAHLWTLERKQEILLREGKRILDGAIWFTALLSRMDGLVLMDYNLFVRGFGVILNSTEMPSGVKAFQASSAELLKSSITPLNLESFGTRHRSMAAHCARNPGSIGFVISKDGGVRVFMRVGKRLVMWDNIMLSPSTLPMEEIHKAQNFFREASEQAEVHSQKQIESKMFAKLSPDEQDRFLLKEYNKLFRKGGGAKQNASPR